MACGLNGLCLREHPGSVLYLTPHTAYFQKEIISNSKALHGGGIFHLGFVDELFWRELLPSLTSLVRAHTGTIRGDRETATHGDRCGDPGLGHGLCPAPTPGGPPLHDCELGSSGGGRPQGGGPISARAASSLALAHPALAEPLPTRHFQPRAPPHPSPCLRKCSLPPPTRPQGPPPLSRGLTLGRWPPCEPLGGTEPSPLHPCCGLNTWASVAGDLGWEAALAPAPRQMALSLSPWYLRAPHFSKQTCPVPAPSWQQPHRLLL